MENWEKEYDEQDFELGTSLDGDSVELNHPKIKAFIRKVRQEGYEEAEGNILDVIQKKKECGYEPETIVIDLIADLTFGFDKENKNRDPL